MDKRTIYRRCFYCFLFSVFSIVTFAQTTWYVSQSGSNANTGLSINEAFSSITHVFGLSACGDSVMVLGGSYHEKVNAYALCPANNRIIIQGDPSARPLIIGDSTVFNKYAIGATGSGYLFRHFRLQSPYPDSCTQSNMVVVGSGDFFEFDDVIVEYGGYDGMKTTVDCANSDFAFGWTVRNSEIRNNGLACPSAILNGDGIDFTGCHDCLISNTVIRDNKGHQLQVKLQASNVTVEGCYIEGINMLQIGLPGNTAQCDTSLSNADGVCFSYNTFFAKGDTNDFVIKMADVANLTIENNTFIKDSVNVNVGFICFGGCGSASNWQYAPITTLVRNNIFYNRASQPFFGGLPYVLFDPYNSIGTSVNANYNLYYDVNGEFLTPPDGGANSIIADPLFCDYPNSFELSDLSPCINEGDASSANDPDGTQNDIGAFYFANSCVVGIEEEADFLTCIAYPNPFDSELIVGLPSRCDHANVKLLNARGEIIRVIAQIRDGYRLDTDELSAGIYILVFDYNGIPIESVVLVKN